MKMKTLEIFIVYLQNLLIFITTLQKLKKKKIYFNKISYKPTTSIMSGKQRLPVAQDISAIFSKHFELVSPFRYFRYSDFYTLIYTAS